MAASQLVLLLVLVCVLEFLPGFSGQTTSTSTTPWPELGQKRQNNRRDFVNPKNPINANLPAISLSYPVNNNDNAKNQGRDFVASPTPANNSPQKNVWGPPVNTTPVPTSNTGRRDYVAPNVNAKPSLPNAPTNNPKPNNPSISPNGGNTQNSGKRDYVAPNVNVKPNTPKTPIDQRPVVNPPVGPNNGLNQNTGKRDYVAPNVNVPKPPTGTQKPVVNPATNTGGGQTTGKRDFVANNVRPMNPQNGPTQPSKIPINSPTSGISYAQKVGGGTANVATSTVKPNIPTTSASNKQSLDDELREFSEALIKKDTSNTIKHVKIDYQGMTRSSSLKDEAPKELLSINPDVYKVPSVAKLILLHNNYILESKVNEVYTAQEKIEENNFLDTILSTPVMQHTRNFLIKKGKISKDPKEFRDLLKVIWFNMYSRGGGKIGSSGFEHVFLTEIKNEEVSGLHNWLYFDSEEKKNTLNYLGYMKKLEFDKGAILKLHFKFMNIDKPVGSMFIGTSPELEIALYSTCFILKPDEPCPLRAGGKNFIIRTYTYRYRGKNMIGSAFPDI